MPLVTVSCTNCGFSKDLNQSSAPPNGTKITCPKCQGSFIYKQSETTNVPTNNVVPGSALASSSSAPLPPPKLHPPQMNRELSQKQLKKKMSDRLKPVGVIVGVTLAVMVLIYGIVVGYTKLTAKLEADNWATLKIITSSEQDERDDIISKNESLLAASDFNQLDKIADDYRTTKAAFEDGEWKLSVFYDEMAYYLRKTPEENWVSRINKLKEWAAAKPDSITARVALAECLDGYAFHGRGAAYANEVQEDQWRRFQERLEESKAVLDQAQNLQKKCPGWWAAYQRLAVGLQWNKSQYFDFLNSAISYEPTYNVFYYRAAFYLLPWWFGDDGEWEYFAKSASNSVGGNAGDILYTRIIWFMSRRTPRDVVTKNSKIQWKRVENGIQLIRKDYYKEARN